MWTQDLTVKACFKDMSALQNKFIWRHDHSNETLFLFLAYHLTLAYHSKFKIPPNLLIQQKVFLFYAKI